MKAEILHNAETHITGRYVANENENQPQCTWVWDVGLGEIHDVIGTSQVTIAYAKNMSEFMAWLKEVK